MKRLSLSRVTRDYRLDVFVLVWIPYALLVWRFWFVIDDAFISFRYARNLALGHGLRYNLGDHLPVEGYSNFLWVIICSVFEFFHMDITFWPVLLSAACGTVLLWLVFDLLRRRLELSLFVVVLATLSLGCFPPFAVWSTSGLATMPFALLVFVTFERLVLRHEGPDGIGGGLAGLALALIRIEGIAWAAMILLLALLSRRPGTQRRWRPFVTFALIVAIGFAIYFAWRYHYYQALLPNTAYTKGALDAVRLLRGVNYLISHVLIFLTPILILPGMLAALRPRRLGIGVPTVALAWAFPAYAVLVTGDWMPMGRFLVPGFAFATVLLAWLLQDIWVKGIVGRSASLLMAGGAIVLGLLPGWNLHLVSRPTRERFAFRHFLKGGFESEYERWHGALEFVPDQRVRGKALRSYVAQRRFPDEFPSLEVGAVGAVGYYSGLYVYDHLGLVTAEVGRGPVRRDLKIPSPGHDKCVLREYFLKYRPTIWLDFRVTGNDPRVLARQILHVARRMDRDYCRLPLLRNRYGPDFARASRDEVDGQVLYLVVWRRLAAGQTPQAAWADFRARLDTLARKGHLPPPPPS